jgi:predicted CoA-binding protein
LSSRTWAVVGLTNHEYRAAHKVAAFLQANGMRIVPVNPLAESVLGENGYAHLSDIDFPIDVVDIFRRSDMAGQHVDEAIAIGARCVWLQLGVIDEQAARRAQDAGLDVVMDACPAIEWPRYGVRRR